MSDRPASPLPFPAPRGGNVVDLAKYRAARAREEELPLFARPLNGSPATVAPFQRLSGRQIAHRARMLAHLDARRQ